MRTSVTLRRLRPSTSVHRWAGFLAVVGLIAGVTVAMVAAGPTTTLAAGPGPVVVGNAPGPTPPTGDPNLLTTARSAGRTVSLTFDDGPDPASTPRILDLLARHHVRAVFCMIGRNAQAHPDLVRRVVAEGHRLCDHTMTHDAAIGSRPPAVIDSQLRASQAALVGVSHGWSVDYFRAPEGRWTTALTRTCAQDGMTALGWDVDPRDWARPGTGAIVARVEQRIHPGAVILLHDGGGPRGQTVAAVEQLLPWLDAQGYRTVWPVAP